MSDETPLVSYEWCRRTGGSLTAPQRRRLLAASLRAYSAHARDLVRLATGQRRTEPVALPTAPDSGAVDAALKAAAEQGPDLEAHGLRTWLFGGALAALDGVKLDDELFCIAAIVHDAGAAEPVDQEDFTVRSADMGVEALHALGKTDPDRERQLRDGIVAHLTSGVTVEESAIGTYVQAGAVLDLAGLRLVDLPKGTVEEVFDRHPAGHIRQRIIRVVREESEAVPEGRFAQLRRLGFTLAIQASPTLRNR